MLLSCLRSGNQIIERSITGRVDAQFIVTCIRQQNMTSEETILVGEDYANLIQRCNAIGEAYVLLNVDLDVISLLICYMQIVFRLEAKTCNNRGP
jgi:predicted ABC-type ATPase